MSSQFLSSQWLAAQLLSGHWLGASSEESAGAQVESDSSTANGYRVMVAAKSVIESLALTDSPTVLIRKVPVDQGIALPAGTGLPVVILAPWREQMRPSPIGVDDIAYGVICLTFDEDNREGTLANDLERSLLWRETIRKAFIGQRVVDLEACIYCEVSALDLIIREAWAANYFASALLLTFVIRELHGS